MQAPAVVVVDVRPCGEELELGKTGIGDGLKMRPFETLAVEQVRRKAESHHTSSGT